MEKEGQNYGRAYALMDFNYSKRAVEEVLVNARQAAQTPSELEISVRDVKELMADRTIDPELVKCIGENSIYPTFPEKYRSQMSSAKPVNMRDLKYVLEAKYVRSTNEEVAAEITDVTNYLYQALGRDKPFNSVVIAKAPDQQYYPWTND